MNPFPFLSLSGETWKKRFVCKGLQGDWFILCPRTPHSLWLAGCPMWPLSVHSPPFSCSLPWGLPPQMSSRVWPMGNPNRRSDKGEGVGEDINSPALPSGPFGLAIPLHGRWALPSKQPPLHSSLSLQVLATSSSPILWSQEWCWPQLPSGSPKLHPHLCKSYLCKETFLELF